MKNAEIRKVFETYDLEKRKAMQARVCDAAARCAKEDAVDVAACQLLDEAVRTLELPRDTVRGKFTELFGLNARRAALPGQIAELEKAKPGPAVGKLERALQDAKAAALAEKDPHKRRHCEIEIAHVQEDLAEAQKRFDALREMRDELARLDSFGPGPLPWKTAMPAAWIPPSQQRSPFVAAGRAAFEEVSSCH